MDYLEDEKWFDYKKRMEEGRTFRAYTIAKMEAINAPSATAYFNMWNIISYKLALGAHISGFREESEEDEKDPWDQLYSGMDFIAEAMKYDDWDDSFKEQVVGKYVIDVQSAEKKALVRNIYDIGVESLNHPILQKISTFSSVLYEAMVKGEISEDECWGELWWKYFYALEWDHLEYEDAVMLLDSCYCEIEKKIEEYEKEKLKNQGKLFGKGKALAKTEQKLENYRKKLEKAKKVIDMHNNVVLNLLCSMDMDAIWNHITEHFFSGETGEKLYETAVALGWEEQEENMVSES